MVIAVGRDDGLPIGGEEERRQEEDMIQDQGAARGFSRFNTRSGGSGNGGEVQGIEDGYSRIG